MVCPSDARNDEETVLATPTWEQGAYWIGLPLAGAGVGWLAQRIADWVASLPAAPFQGPFELLASLPQPHALIGALAIGGVAGLVLAFLAHSEELTVRVGPRQVVLTRNTGNDVATELSASSITAAFRDDNQLVLLGTDSSELVREKCDLSADRLAAGFRRHGLPWYSGDPYEHEYRRWVEDLPDLPPTVNALLRARAQVVEKGDDDDAEQLRQELGKLSIVVRDRDKRQYWRRTTASSSPPLPQ